LQIRETGSSVNRTVEPASLTLVSAERHEEPDAIALNALTSKERRALVTVLRGKFSDHSLRNFSLLSSVPSLQVIKTISKWTSQEFDRRFPIRRVVNIDMQAWFEEAVSEARGIAATTDDDGADADMGDEVDDNERGAGGDVADGDGQGVPSTDGPQSMDIDEEPDVKSEPKFRVSPALRVHIETQCDQLREVLKARRDSAAGEQQARQQHAAAHRVQRSAVSLGGGAVLPSDVDRERADRSRRATIGGSGGAPTGKRK